MNKKMRLAAVAAVPLAAVLFLAGCADNGGSMPGMDHGGSSSAPSESAEADFNMADSMFAMMMIPHHEQAVEMSDMLLAKQDIDPRVMSLAREIKAAQGPEITQMQGWLEAWGLPAMSGPAGMPASTTRGATASCARPSRVKMVSCGPRSGNRSVRDGGGR